MLNIILDAEDIREIKQAIPILVGLSHSQLSICPFDMTRLNGYIITLWNAILGEFLRIGLGIPEITNEIWVCGH